MERSGGGGERDTVRIRLLWGDQGIRSEDGQVDGGGRTEGSSEVSGRRDVDGHRRTKVACDVGMEGE